MRESGGSGGRATLEAARCKVKFAVSNFVESCDGRDSQDRYSGEARSEYARAINAIHDPSFGDRNEIEIQERNQSKRSRIRAAPRIDSLPSQRVTRAAIATRGFGRAATFSAGRRAGEGSLRAHYRRDET